MGSDFPKPCHAACVAENPSKYFFGFFKNSSAHTLFFCYCPNTLPLSKSRYRGRKPKTTPVANTLRRMVDLEAKRAEGKGMGYDRWAAKHNLKQMAATVTAYQQSGLFFPGEIGRSLFRVLYRHAEKHYRAEKCGKEAERGKGVATAGACLFQDPPHPWTGYDENKPRRQDIETFVGKVGLPNNCPTYPTQ